MSSRDTNRYIPWVIFIVGLTSITTQVLLIRELVVIFYGNELSAGVMLGIWLFWTALGSSLLPRIIKVSRHRKRRIALLQILIAFSLPFILILVRSSRQILGITLGEMIGFVPMLLITLTTLAPFCLINGMLYTLACGLVHQTEDKASQAIGKVYLWEALGAGIGGLAASLIFVRLFDPPYVFLSLALLNLMTALVLGNFIPCSSAKFRNSIIASFIVLGCLACIRFGPDFRKVCDRIPWKGYDLVTTHNTIYGNIGVTRFGDQFSFFQNGLLIFTVPDRLTAEESVHFALLEHLRPQRVLLIGGGLGGSITETLRHPSIVRVDYVELDPGIVRLSEHILPQEHIQSLKDSRVHIHHTDGRRFVKSTTDEFEVIILNLPNPYTAQLNRFYTLEFFREVNRCLSPGGVFALHVQSSENAIGPELSDFLSTLSATLTNVFPDLVIIPGETNRFIVANQPDYLTANPDILVQRLRERNLQTLYVREYYVPYQMTQERQEYLQSQIHPVIPNRLNRDFRPIGYYYDTILWATYFSSGFKRLFLVMAHIKFQHIAGLFLLTAVLVILVFWRPSSRSRLFAPGILYSVLGVGFTEISLEVVLILGFQVLYGYAYQQLAVIVAGYMVGLALGSWLAVSKNVKDKRAFPLFRLCQLGMIFYPLLIAGIFYILHTAPDPSHAFWMSWLFPLLTAGAGFIGGYQFPLANRLYLRHTRSIHRVAGLLYGSDLLGSSAGAILVSAFIIPLLGIYPTLLLLSVLNIFSFIVISLSQELSPRVND